MCKKIFNIVDINLYLDSFIISEILINFTYLLV